MALITADNRRNRNTHFRQPELLCPLSKRNAVAKVYTSRPMSSVMKSCAESQRAAARAIQYVKMMKPGFKYSRHLNNQSPKNHIPIIEERSVSSPSNKGDMENSNATGAKSH